MQCHICDKSAYKIIWYGKRGKAKLIHLCFDHWYNSIDDYEDNIKINSNWKNITKTITKYDPTPYISSK